MDIEKVTSIGKIERDKKESFLSDAMAAIEAKIFFTNGEEKIACNLRGNLKDLTMLKAIIDDQLAEKIAGLRDNR